MRWTISQSKYESSTKTTRLKVQHRRFETVNTFGELYQLNPILHTYKSWNILIWCRVSLNEMAKHFHLKLVWVRSHSNSSGNVPALEKRRARLFNEETDILLNVSLLAQLSGNYGHFITSLFLKKLKILMTVLTGLCKADVHTRRLRFPYFDFCRNELKEETVEH